MNSGSVFSWDKIVFTEDVEIDDLLTWVGHARALDADGDGWVWGGAAYTQACASRSWLQQACCYG